MYDEPTKSNTGAAPYPSPRSLPRTERSPIVQIRETDAHLEAVISELEDHLEPVLGIPMPRPADDPATKPHSEIEAIAERLTRHVHRLAGLVQRIRL